MAQTYRYVTTPKEVIGTRDGQDFYVGGAQVAVADNPASGSGSNGNNANQQGSSPPPVNNPVTPTVDPITDYYNKLADPAVADQPIKDQIQKNMQAALDAIDQRYVSIYANEANNATDRLGQTRSIDARSGTLGGDFAVADNARTVAANDKARGAIDAAKAAEASAVTLAAQGQLTKLAADEVAARRADALGKATEAQAQFKKAQEDAQALITKLSNAGATLTDAQKAVLMRNSGYDEATFDSLYNSGLPQNQKATITYHTIKKADGSEALLQISTKPDGTTTQKEMDGYNTGGQVVKEYGGRPYVQTTDAQGNIVLKPVAGFIKSTSPSDTVAAQAAAFNLKVKQAPAQVSNLQAAGYSWGQIADYMKQQGIDPGTPEIDDALHRAFQSQSDYEAWAKAQKATSASAAFNSFLDNAIK